MGRLFWKFLSAFWLTLIVDAVGVGSAVWLHRQADFDEVAEHLSPRPEDASSGELRHRFGVVEPVAVLLAKQPAGHDRHAVEKIVAAAARFDQADLAGRVLRQARRSDGAG